MPLTISTEITYDPRSMVALADDGRWKGQVAGFFVQLNNQGRTIRVTRGHETLDLSQTQYDQAAKDGMKFTEQFPMMPQTMVFVAVLRDLTSGVVGSVRIPIQKYIYPSD